MGNVINCNCNKDEDNNEMNISNSQATDSSLDSQEKEDSIIVYTEQITLSKNVNGIINLI